MSIHVEIKKLFRILCPYVFMCYYNRYGSRSLYFRGLFMGVVFRRDK